MEDKLNPNHYKGLKDLYALYGDNTDKKPAQVIDVIESFTHLLGGGYATNMGNTIKYLCRFNLKSHDAYQKSQVDKNIEELGKAVWYLERFVSIYDRDYDCNKSYLSIINDGSVKHADSSDANLMDIYISIRDNYPYECREDLAMVFHYLGQSRFDKSLKSLKSVLATYKNLQNN